MVRKLSGLTGTLVAIGLVTGSIWIWGSAGRLAHGADRPQAALWAARSGAIAALAAAQVLGMTFMVDQLFGRDRGGEWIRLAAGALCVVALAGAVALGMIA
jgi:hypothetical protein